LGKYGNMTCSRTDQSGETIRWGSIEKVSINPETFERDT